MKPLLVTLALAGTALIATWPLAARMHDSLPGDYGEPLFATWAMAWVSDRITQLAFSDFWTANIFFPERGTFAFSEPFIAQSVMVLPVYLVSGNPILGYNVAFLLTFVLTGVGTYLLARALTGSFVAGCVAAFIASFHSFRLSHEVAHLHTLSIHWLPFALYWLHRYFQTDRRRHLALAAASVFLLNLSSISYTAYGAAFVTLFAIADAIATGRWRVFRVWLELWAAAAAAAAATLPLLLPHLEVERRFGFPASIDGTPLLHVRVDASDPRVVALSFLLLALAAAYPVAMIGRRSIAAAKVVACTIASAFVIMTAAGPMRLNVPVASENLATTPAYLAPRREAPAIYRAVEGIRPGAILVELPFGDASYDLRYMYFSTAHRRRLLNGFSGLFPPSFRARQRVLAQPLLDPEASARAIGGATHVIVHRQAWKDDTGARVAAWLEAFNAIPIADVEGAVLYELPVREGFARQK